MTTARQRSGLSGVSNVRKLLRRLEPELTSDVREAVEASAGILLRAMLARTPRRSGTLAGELRIKYGRDRLSARVGVIGKRSLRRAWYARFVEYGTVDIPAQPFMIPAAEEVAPKIDRIVDAAIDRVLAKVAGI